MQTKSNARNGNNSTALAKRTQKPKLKHINAYDLMAALVEGGHVVKMYRNTEFTEPDHPRRKLSAENWVCLKICLSEGGECAYDIGLFFIEGKAEIESVQITKIETALEMLLI